MQTLFTVLTIAEVIVALALIVVVLLQHGRQQGLSGAIAGGAETFFGKNKGRTVDAMLKKFTSVVAILFIVLALALTFVTGKLNDADEDTDTETTETVDSTSEITEIPVQISDDKIIFISNDGYTDIDGTELTMDENSNFVYEDGTVYATNEEFTAALEQMQLEAEAAEADVEEAETDEDVSEAVEDETAEEAGETEVDETESVDAE